MATKKTAKPSQAYKGNGEHNWEGVCGDQQYSDRRRPSMMRLRVPGGYLYRAITGGMVFVPMPGVVKHKV